MKNATKVLCLFALGLFYSTIGLAQVPNFCGTDEATARSLKEHPELVQGFLAEQTRLEQLDQQAFAQGYPDQYSRGVVYTIPVVFHILHQNGSENISDAQINDEMRILNEDYNKLNADISQVVSAFQGITGNVQFNFVLAKKDPQGNCTNGIDRIVSSETTVGSSYSSALNMWPASNYLNIYTVKSFAPPNTGAAGYTHLPGSGGGADAIFVLNNYVGSIGTSAAYSSRCLTHEIGHWFNLNHVWGGTNQPGVACGDDGVTDTPITKGWTTCNLTGNSCGHLDNVQNYMEYAYCSKMFTAGQATRMRNCATGSTASRNNLWSTTNLAATGISTPAVLCKADFKSSSTANSVCQGSSLTFTDLSWNGTPTSWSWTFTGGTPATSTAQAPVIQYNTPGTYSVSLTVTNGSGSVSATKTSYITVYATPGLTGIYSEGFEGSAIPNANWQVNNANSGSNTWVQTNVAAATGTKCVRIVNAASYVGYIDELISPPINMTTVGTNAKLTFKIAHSQKMSTADTANDQLTVLVSTNCGQTWSQRMILKGTTLATAPPQTTPYTPTSSQWVTKSINLTGAFASSNNLLVMFRFTSDGGNNIYLDDVNLGGTLGTGIADNLADNLNFNVYPNPMASNSVIAFSLSEKQDVNIKILDVVGREVAAVYTGSLNAGDYQYSIANKAELTSGIYFVKLMVNNQMFTKKLIVK